MKERCLQDRTGSCRGCNVLNIVEEKVHSRGIQRDITKISLTARRIQNDLCLEGRIIQTDLLKPPKTTYLVKDGAISTVVESTQTKNL